MSNPKPTYSCCGEAARICTSANLRLEALAR
jgi:hypothetical protein